MASRQVLKKKRVLVVEDEFAIRRGVVDALTLSGYDVVEAADGEMVFVIVAEKMPGGRDA